MIIPTKNPLLVVALILGGGLLLTRKTNATTVTSRGAASTPQAAAARFSISQGTAQQGGKPIGYQQQQSPFSAILNTGSQVANAASAIANAFNRQNLGNGQVITYQNTNGVDGMKAVQDVVPTAKFDFWSDANYTGVADATPTANTMPMSQQLDPYLWGDA